MLTPHLLLLSFQAVAPWAATPPLEHGQVLRPLGQEVGVQKRGGAPSVSWHVDSEVARARARENGRHVLVSFDGRGWCGFCERLHAEVFDVPGFGATLSGDFEFVSLDFDARYRPRAEGKLAEQHASLREALEVKSFPEVVLMTPGGVPYARFAYEPIGREAFEAKLKDARDEAVFLEQNIPLVEQALVGAQSPEEALAAGDAAIALLNAAEAHVLARPLVPIVQAQLAAPKIEIEREKSAVLALSLAQVVDDALVDRAFRLDPKNVEGLPEAALAGAFHSLKSARRLRPLLDKAEQLISLGKPFNKERAARLFGDCAFWVDSWLDDPERASILARYALSLEPTSPGLRSMLEGLSGGR